MSLLAVAAGSSFRPACAQINFAKFLNFAKMSTKTAFLFPHSLSLVLRAWHAGSSAAQRLAPTNEQPAYDATQQQLKLAAYPARRWEGRVERNA